MIKKIIFFLLITTFLNSSFLFSQKEKVTVIVKTAKIYAESSENSYEIDRAKLGDVLTLFETWRGEKEWLYVIFRSERWKGEVTGFIKSSQVVRGEVIPDELIETTAAEAETKESEPEAEIKEEKDELPSLKDIMKSTEKKEETVKPEEVQPEQKEDIPELESRDETEEAKIEEKTSEEIPISEEEIKEERSLFVARDIEISQMNGFLEKALAGKGQVIFVKGEAGSGKTALIQEFAAMESLLAGLQSQSNWLTSQLGGLSGGTQ